MIGVKYDTAAVDRAIKALGPAIGGRAVSRAINRSIVTTKAHLARDMSANVGLKVGTIKEQLRTTNATATRLEGSIKVTGKPIPLIEFKATQTRTGVTARMPSPKQYPGAFIATVGAGHKGVFKRVPGKAQRRGPAPMRAQLPIYEMHGPSLAKVFTTVTPGALEAGAESMAKNLAHEVEYELTKLST